VNTKTPFPSRTIKPGQFVVGSFFASDNTCEICQAGYQSACVHREAGPGKTVAVVRDGVVGLIAVLAARQLGAERVIALSRHEARQKLARKFGATDIVTERGEADVTTVKERAARPQGADKRAYPQFRLGGAGGARTHDRRIMRSMVPCTPRASCTDTTESCRRWR